MKKILLLAIIPFLVNAKPATQIEPENLSKETAKSEGIVESPYVDPLLKDHITEESTSEKTKAGLYKCPGNSFQDKPCDVVSKTSTIKFKEKASEKYKCKATSCSDIPEVKLSGDEQKKNAARIARVNANAKVLEATAPKMLTDEDYKKMIKADLEKPVSTFGDVHVNAYRRKNGIYVDSYTRHRPNR